MEDTPTNPESTSFGTPQSAVSTKSGNPYAIPIAIIAGFGMIALAIFMGGGNRSTVTTPTLGGQDRAEEGTLAPDINANDHVLGNPNAPIVIVEYSDFDCPFCKTFHDSMRQVMNKYGSDGKVAWVYRHFPIDSRHPSASYIAAASECVAELGDNEAFWSFTDQVFDGRSINELTDTSKLSGYAESAGVSVADFEDCLDSERTTELVAQDYEDAINAGVTGTPYSFLMVAGQQLPINGSQPFEYLDTNIENILSELEAAETEEIEIE